MNPVAACFAHRVAMTMTSAPRACCLRDCEPTLSWLSRTSAFGAISPSSVFVRSSTLSSSEYSRTCVAGISGSELSWWSHLGLATPGRLGVRRSIAGQTVLAQALGGRPDRAGAAAAPVPGASARPRLGMLPGPAGRRGPVRGSPGPVPPTCCSHPLDRRAGSCRQPASGPDLRKMSASATMPDRSPGLNRSLSRAISISCRAVRARAGRTHRHRRVGQRAARPGRPSGPQDRPGVSAIA